MNVERQHSYAERDAVTAITSVGLSVRPFITRWYCAKVTKPISNNQL